MNGARRNGFLWAASGLLFGVALFLTLLQKHSGTPFSTTVPLRIKPDAKQVGHGVRAEIPRDHRNDLVRRHAVLLKDGRPHGFRARSNKAVKNHGSGRYNLRDNKIWLSSVAGGEHLSLRIPLAVPPALPPVLFTITLGCLVMAGRHPYTREWAEGLGGRLSAVPNTALGALAAGAALAVGYFTLADTGSGFDNTFSAKGMPYSDAMGWNELALSLSLGEGLQGGFRAHRPFYAVFLGALYQVASPSLGLALGLNVVTLAATVFFACMLAGDTVSRTAGIGLGIFILTSSAYLSPLHSPLTEPLGLALGACSLYLLCRGLVEGKASILFMAGMFFAFGEITRTFMLLAFPFMVALAAIATWSRAGEHRFRNGLVHSAAFAAGTIIVIAPWSIHQKQTHGVWSISANSADLLYGASRPGSTPWDTTLYQELAEAGIPDNIRARYDFFMTRYQETVTADPAGYVRRVATASLESVNHFPLDRTETKGFLILCGLATCVGTALRTRSLSGLAGFALLWPAVYALCLLPTAALVALAGTLSFTRGHRPGRIVVAVLLVEIAGSALLSGLIGNFGISRLAGFQAWPITLLLLLGIHHLATLLTRGIDTFRKQPWHHPQTQDVFPQKAPVYAAGAVLALCVAATFCVVVKNTTGSRDVAVKASPSHLQLIRWICTTFPDACNAGALADNITIREVTLGEYRTSITGGEDIGHWSRAFGVRPRDRTVAFLRQGDGRSTSPGLIPTQFTGHLPKSLQETSRHILVAVQNTDLAAPLGFEIDLFEALALIPLSGETPLPAQALVFQPSPEALALLPGSSTRRKTLKESSKKVERPIRNHKKVRPEQISSPLPPS